jgi:hypothetical protein
LEDFKVLFPATNLGNSHNAVAAVYDRRWSQKPHHHPKTSHPPLTTPRHIRRIDGHRPPLQTSSLPE